MFWPQRLSFPRSNGRDNLGDVRREVVRLRQEVDALRADMRAVQEERGVVVRSVSQSRDSLDVLAGSTTPSAICNGTCSSSPAASSPISRETFSISLGASSVIPLESLQHCERQYGASGGASGGASWTSVCGGSLLSRVSSATGRVWNEDRWRYEGRESNIAFCENSVATQWCLLWRVLRLASPCGGVDERHLAHRVPSVLHCLDCVHHEVAERTSRALQGSSRHPRSLRRTDPLDIDHLLAASVLSPRCQRDTRCVFGGPLAWVPGQRETFWGPPPRLTKPKPEVLWLLDPSGSKHVFVPVCTWALGLQTKLWAK